MVFKFSLADEEWQVFSAQLSSAQPLILFPANSTPLV